MISRDAVYEILRQVNDPELGRPITDLGMVQDVMIEGDRVGIAIKLTIPGCPLKAKISQDVKAKVQELPGVREVQIEFGSMNEDERRNVTQTILSKYQGQAAEAGISTDFVKHIVCVASGKGGVGKSTATANLAAALAQKGHVVGVLDADVYGFSIPRMLGVHDNPTVIDQMIIPAEVRGIKVISMGLFLDEDTPVIWRGPMLHKAVQQFMSDVHWGDLDIMLIDLPPGTGDVTLTIAQKFPKSELLVITTPQKAAANVAVRVGKMAEKVNLRVIGVVENMSYFLLPDGRTEHIFGNGGGRELAQKLNTELLAEIPLDTQVRQAADDGLPMIWHTNDSAARRAYEQCASRLEKLLRLNSPL